MITWTELPRKASGGGQTNVVAAASDGAVCVLWETCNVTNRRKYGSRNWYCHGPLAITEWKRSEAEAKAAYENGISIEVNH